MESPLPVNRAIALQVDGKEYFGVVKKRRHLAVVRYTDAEGRTQCSREFTWEAIQRAITTKEPLLD